MVLVFTAARQQYMQVTVLMQKIMDATTLMGVPFRQKAFFPHMSSISSVSVWCTECFFSPTWPTGPTVSLKPAALLMLMQYFYLSIVAVEGVGVKSVQFTVNLSQRQRAGCWPKEQEPGQRLKHEQRAVNVGFFTKFHLQQILTVTAESLIHSLQRRRWWNPALSSQSFSLFHRLLLVSGIFLAFFQCLLLGWCCCVFPWAWIESWKTLVSVLLLNSPLTGGWAEFAVHFCWGHLTKHLQLVHISHVWVSDHWSQ